MSQPFRNQANRHRHRASSYVMVAGTSLIITIIGLSAVTAVRIQRRGADELNDMGTAQFYAQSALDHGLTMINDDKNWRNNHGAGAWITNQSIDNGSYDLDAVFVDLGDGDPSDDDVILIGTGRIDGIIHKAQLTIVMQSGRATVAPGSWRRRLN